MARESKETKNVIRIEHYFDKIVKKIPKNYGIINAKSLSRAQKKDMQKVASVLEAIAFIKFVQRTDENPINENHEIYSIGEDFKDCLFSIKFLLYLTEDWYLNYFNVQLKLK